MERFELTFWFIFGLVVIDNVQLFKKVQILNNFVTFLYSTWLCILQFRKCMILELHQKEIFTMPLEDIECENYYAVEYETKFYIGRY